MGLDPVTGTLLALSATSTAVSFQQQRQAQGQQEEASEIEAARQQAEAQRRKRMAARKARIRRAQIAQAAQGMGIADSSGFFSAMGATSRGVSEQSSFLFGNRVAASAINDRQEQAAEHATRGSIAQSIGRITGSLAMQGFQSDFFSDTTPQVDTRTVSDITPNVDTRTVDQL